MIEVKIHLIDKATPILERLAVQLSLMEIDAEWIRLHSGAPSFTAVEAELAARIAQQLGGST